MLPGPRHDSAVGPDHERTALAIRLGFLAGDPTEAARSLPRAWQWVIAGRVHRGVAMMPRGLARPTEVTRYGAAPGFAASPEAVPDRQPWTRDGNAFLDTFRKAEFCRITGESQKSRFGLCLRQPWEFENG